MQDLVFYSFAFFIVLAAIFVITAKHPVHAVLLLIFAFFNAAGLFILLGAEYIAMTLIIVYVGAVAVLFLFVIMMLDVDFAMLRQGFLKNMPIATMLGLLIFVELFIALKASRKSIPLAKKAVDLTITNTEALGLQLYTDYFFAFQISGFILLVAMIGAITLTVRHAKTVRRQNIYEQVTRKREECVELVQVKVGEGVKV